MARDQERNRLIYQLHKEGLSFSRIGQRFAISSTRARMIFKKVEDDLARPPLPSGISLKTAHLFERAFGYWPSDENAFLIAEREREWLRASGIQLRNIAEIKAWLQRVLSGDIEAY